MTCPPKIGPGKMFPFSLPVPPQPPDSNEKGPPEALLVKASKKVASRRSSFGTRIGRLGVGGMVRIRIA